MGSPDKGGLTVPALYILQRLCTNDKQNDDSLHTFTLTLCFILMPIE